MQQRSIFISFEGSEGCGKSTQIRRLAARLETLSRPVTLVREPGGTPIGEEIRQLLQFSKINKAMTAEAELLLFTASRAQLVRERIEPALRTGSIVIADRFLDSTTVYQGVARRIDAAVVKFVNDFAVADCRPNLTFLLDLDPGRARERMLSQPRTPDRMEQQPVEFYEAVRNGYLTLAEHETSRVCVIDASRTAEEIEQEIWRHLQPLLG